MSIFPEILTGVRAHLIEVKYSGDAKFLPSSSQTEVQVTGPVTTLNLAAPAIATLGAPVTLTAAIRSEGGTPTGQVVFLDGNTGLGSAALNAAGVATLTVNTLAAGAHSLTASYAGDGNFGGSTSPAVTTMVVNRDFSLSAVPPSATVTAGQSAMFNLTVTPDGGFADPVTFSCPVLTGITCSFNPPMVTPNAGAATTMLTVTTSAGVLRYGQTLGINGFVLLPASLALVGILVSLKKKARSPHAAFLRVAAGGLTVITLALTLVSCGGYTTSGQTSHGTVSIMVTAQSRNISHTTNVSVTVQ
jgi:Bacterial Ig-like domain (group 3)